MRLIYSLPRRWKSNPKLNVWLVCGGNTYEVPGKTSLRWGEDWKLWGLGVIIVKFEERILHLKIYTNICQAVVILSVNIQPSLSIEYLSSVQLICLNVDVIYDCLCASDHVRMTKVLHIFICRTQFVSTVQDSVRDWTPSGRRICHANSHRGSLSASAPCPPPPLVMQLHPLLQENTQVPNSPLVCIRYSNNISLL